MSAHLVFRRPEGPLSPGSDDAPRPPERHRRKLSAWQTNNGSGRLIRKQDERAVDSVALAANFTLHEADHGAGGVIAIRIHRTFSIDSRLRFCVVERPAVGAVRVFDRAGDDAELVYLASHHADAEEWLTRHGYPDAVLSEITADSVATDAIEGRTVA
ncbi:MAG: hypothetical protein R3D70_23355 [Rhizobiaceae bacterium]